MDDNGSPFPESLDFNKFPVSPGSTDQLKVLIWLRNLHEALSTNSKEEIIKHEKYVISELSNLLSAPSTAPMLGRTMRQLTARCFFDLFKNGDRKPLFQVTNHFISEMNTLNSKLDKSFQRRHSYVVCLGKIYKAAGSDLISISPHLVLSLLSLVKLSLSSSTGSVNCGLRASIFRAIAEIFPACGHSFDDALNRKIWRYAKESLTDKSYAVVRETLLALDAMVISTSFFKSQETHLEPLKQHLLAALDSPLAAVRKPAAQCLSSCCIMDFDQRQPLSSSSKVRPSPRRNSDDLETSGGDRPPPGSIKRSASTLDKRGDPNRPSSSALPQDGLRILVQAYLKPSSSSRLRTGLINTFRLVFIKMGSSTIESEFKSICAVILGMVAASVENYNGAFPLRRLVLALEQHFRLLFDLILTLIGEAGKKLALQHFMTFLNSASSSAPSKDKRQSHNFYHFYHHNGSITAAAGGSGNHPPPRVLTVVLTTMANLIQDLDSAVSDLDQTLCDTIIQVIHSHRPSSPVQAAACLCLKRLMVISPRLVIPTTQILLDSLSNNIKHLKKSSDPQLVSSQCLGEALGLSTLLSVCSNVPAYASRQQASDSLQLAMSLLRSSNDSQFVVPSTYVLVAWRLISGLVTLGSAFVKPHMGELLLLWKSAMPKPAAYKQRTDQEIYFLLLIRLGAATSLSEFIKFNRHLLTVDLCKRIQVLLLQTSEFIDYLETPEDSLEDNDQDDHDHYGINNINITARSLINIQTAVLSKILECCNALIDLGSSLSVYAGALTTALAVFADHTRTLTLPSLATTIAAKTRNSESAWDVEDNYSFGITSLLTRHGDANQVQVGFGRQASFENYLDHLLSSPILGAIDNDISLFLASPPSSGSNDDKNNLLVLPPPPVSALVNESILLFAKFFPLQPQKVQESILQQLGLYAQSAKKSSNHSSNTAGSASQGRQYAVLTNIALALLFTFEQYTSGTGSTLSSSSTAANDDDEGNHHHKRNGSGSSLPTLSGRILDLAENILKDTIVSSDSVIRSLSTRALGKLCSLSPDAFISDEVKYLTDRVIRDRDPNVRAGCAMALGEIHSSVGGMAASFHLRTILGILMSLTNDPHPLVHYWALEALANTVAAAGLTAIHQTYSILLLVGKLLISDAHSRDVLLVACSNLEMELPSVVALSHCANSIINVVGPDLRDSLKTRRLLSAIITQFNIDEEDERVRAESIRCFQQMILYSPGFLSISSLTRMLSDNLALFPSPERDATIDALYQLMRSTSAHYVIEAGSQFNLQTRIWLAYDLTPTEPELAGIIKSWLSCTGLDDADSWISHCHNILVSLKKPSLQNKSSTTTQRQQQQENQEVTITLDEEVAAFSTADERQDETTESDVGGGNDISEGNGGFSKDNSDKDKYFEGFRWQTRVFALECLRTLISMFDATKTREAKILPRQGDNIEDEGQEESQPRQQQPLIGKIGDIVGMAFLACTSGIPKMRIVGIGLLDDIINVFGNLPDPEFPQVSLLEQFQAQIASALTPSFSNDSSPELATLAIQVCARFLCSGISDNVDQMGRIVRVLTNALDACSGEEKLIKLGDFQAPTQICSDMLRMSVLSSWAQLQAASIQSKPSLCKVMTDYSQMLVPLWLESLKEFARMRFDPEFDSDFPRELFEYYELNWLSIVEALASLIKTDPESVLKKSSGQDTTSFVLFGICMEALVRLSNGSTTTTASIVTETLQILTALSLIFDPAVVAASGGFDILQQDGVNNNNTSSIAAPVFSEMIDVFGRLVMTGTNPRIQVLVVKIAKDISSTVTVDESSELLDHLFELTRIITLVLTNSLKSAGGGGDDDVSVEAFDALLAIGQILPPLVQIDLLLCLMDVFPQVLDATNDKENDGCLRLLLGSFQRLIKAVNQLIISSGQPDDSRRLVSGVRRLASQILANTTSPRGCLLSLAVLIAQTDCLDPVTCREIADFINKSMSNQETLPIALQVLKSISLRGSSSIVKNRILCKLVSTAAQLIVTTASKSSHQVDEIIDALVFFTKAQPESAVPHAMGLIIPLLVHTAQYNDDDDDDEESSTTVDYLLDLARFSPSSFRFAIQRLVPIQRNSLESLLLNKQ